MVNERVKQMKRQQFISLDSQFISRKKKSTFMGKPHFLEKNPCPPMEIGTDFFLFSSSVFSLFGQYIPYGSPILVYILDFL